MIFSDSFNRADTSAGLGTIPSTTIPWELSGSARIAAQRPLFSTSHTLRPAAVADLGGSDADITITAGGGDAVYARWVDANNWVGARIRRYTVQIPTTNTEYEWYGAFGYGPGGLTPGPTTHNHPDDGKDTWSTSNTACPHVGSYSHKHTVYDEAQWPFDITHTHSRISCVLTGRTRTATGSVEATRYQVIVEKRVSGVITTLGTATVATPTTLRFRANGSTLQAFLNGSSTAVVTVTSADHRTATRHGFGRGPSDVSNTRLDAVIIDTLNSPPSAPTLDFPVSRTVSTGVPIHFRWTFNDPDTGDSQSKAEFRCRAVGASLWQPVSTIIGGTPGYQVGPTTFPADEWEWQVRTWDAAGQAGPWSASAFFTVAAPVITHTITSPAPGETISVAEHLVEWSTPDQDAYQVRTVADTAGAPNTAVVYHDTSTIPYAADRSRLIPFPVTDRAEHIQLRVQTDGLWSDWVSRRVEVAFTLRPEPFAVVAEDTPTGAISITAVNPDPTGDEPASIGNRLHRREAIRIDDGNPVFDGDGIRIGPRVGETFPPNGTVVDQMVAHGQHYAYRVEDLGDNGTARLGDWVVSSVPPKAVGTGNLLDPADSTFETLFGGSTGTWGVTNGTLTAVAAADAPDGRFVLQVTADDDGDVTLTLPAPLPLTGGGTYTVFANVRHQGIAREWRFEVPTLDRDGIATGTFGGSVLEESDEPTVPEEPTITFVLAEAVNAAGDGAVPITPGATRGGTQYLTVIPTDGIQAVELYVDGILQGARLDESPFVWEVDTRLFNNGTHVVSAVVDYGIQRDDGTVVFSVQRPAVEVVFNNVVVQDPTFRLARATNAAGDNPAQIVSGAAVAGTVHLTPIPVSALVTAVEFRLDGVVQATDTTSPFVWSWDTALASNGAHTVAATVTYAGQQATSQTVTTPVTVANDTGGGTPTEFHPTLVGVGTAGKHGSSADPILRVNSFEAWLNRPPGSMAAVTRMASKVGSWDQYLTMNDQPLWADTGRDLFLLCQGYWKQAEFGNKDGYVDDITDDLGGNRVRIPIRPRTHDGRTSQWDFDRTKQSTLSQGMRIDIRHVGTGVMLAGDRTIESINRTSTYVEIKFSGATVSATTAHGVFRSGVNTLSQMANGEWNIHYVALANRLRSQFDSGQVVRMSFLHEGNGDWSAHTGAGSVNRHAAFRNGFAQAYTTMRPLLPGTIFIDFLKSTGRKHAPFELIWPGDDYVDDIQEDTYNRGVASNLTGDARWNAIRDQEEGLADTLAFAIAHGKRVGYQEWAADSRSGGDDPTYIKRMSEWCKAMGTRLSGQFYFNINEPIGGAENNTEFVYHVIHPTATELTLSAAEYRRQWRI